MTHALKPAWRFGPKILIPLVVATLLVAGAAAFILYWAAGRSDFVSVERQIRTTQRAIDDIVARLALEQETIAVWDDTVDYLQRPRPDMNWINLNLGIWPNKIYGHDQIFILNPQDQAVYASIDGNMVPVSRFAAIRVDLQPLIDVTRGRTAAPSHRFDRHPGRRPAGAAPLTTNRAVHDTQMVSVRGRPAAASVMLIRAASPYLRRPAPEPIMINLRFLDGKFLRELEHRNLIDQPRFSHTSNPGPGEQALELYGINHRGIGYFIWRPQLPGSRIMGVLAPTTAIVVLALIALMALLARWLRRSTGDLSDAMVRLGDTMIQLRASEAHAQHLAFHDTLTGLPNRTLFYDRLDHALSRARRGGGLALLLLDLDRFKQVNDTLGHLTGDALIQEFAGRMEALVRDEDTVARLGGDEFAILVRDLGRLEDIDALCQRILSAVHERFELLGNSVFIGVSIGVIQAPEFGLDRHDLLRKGDIALYRAKAEGRHCYRSFSESMDERVQLRGAIEDQLGNALNGGDQLRVYYQPEMGLDGDSIVGLEALVRWQHPEQGLISPEHFVPIAEETGLIHKLGEWVLGEACKAARRWPTLFIAVNLSPVQLRVAGFAQRLIAIVHEANVSPNQIELEVTEGVFIDNDEMATDALTELRAAGFRIALDDFGTGYSSFSYLQRFKVDKIKIDRSFVRHLGQREDSAALVTAVLTIGHAMGLTVTAEGVEDSVQRHFLSAAGCDQMQGFLFSHPLPVEEVAHLLLSRDTVRDAA